MVLSGHEHNYERFAPQDPEGRANAQRGIRQFVVGSGGGRVTTPSSIPFPTARSTMMRATAC